MLLLNSETGSNPAVKRDAPPKSAAPRPLTFTLCVQETSLKISHLVAGVLLLSSIAQAQEPTIERLKEIATRNLELEAHYFVNLCDDIDSKEWCEGYFAAVIATLKSKDKNLCTPSNEVGRFYFDGVWSITKSWLYRQNKTEKVTFYNSIQKALTEDKACN